MKNLRHAEVKDFAHLTVNRKVKVRTLALFSQVYPLSHYPSTDLASDVCSHLFIHSFKKNLTGTYHKQHNTWTLRLESFMPGFMEFRIWPRKEDIKQAITMWLRFLLIYLLMLFSLIFFHFLCPPSTFQLAIWYCLRRCIRRQGRKQNSSTNSSRNKDI